MTGMKPIARHPSIGALQRALDGELPVATAARLERHLQRCAGCADRMTQLRDQSAIAGDYLRSLPAAEVDGFTRARVIAAMKARESSRSRVGRQWRGWAAAAAIAAVLLSSLGVEPVRGWMLERLGLRGVAAAGEAPVATLPTVRVGIDGSIVTFRPAGGPFLLQLQAAQRGGEIVLQRRPSERATAQITNAAGESMLILPNGLLVENTAGSEASYRVSIPAAIEEIVVRVGDGEGRSIDFSAGEVRLPLR